MAVLTFGGVLTGMAMFNLARGQEHNHEAPRVQKEFSDTKDGAAPQAQGMKCCEGMEKMGDMKAGMPMKGEMTGDMKAKMEKMKTMENKMAEKMGEKPATVKTPEAKGEKSQASSDEHQH